MALIVVLILVSVLGLLFGLGGSGSGPVIGAGGDSMESTRALFVAQGALQRSLLQLNIDKTWPGATKAKYPGGKNQTYDVKLYSNTTGVPMQTPAGVEIAPDTTLVLATGYNGDTVRKVAGILEVAGGNTNPGFAGITQGDFYIKGGTVKAFSAPAGDFAPYAIQFEPGAAQVGSLSGEVSIVARDFSATTGDPLLPSTVDGTVASDRVDGDPATPEPGVYEVDALSTVGGELALDAPPTIDFTPPVPYLGGPSVDLGSGSRTILPGHYDDLTTYNDCDLYLEPGDYYFSNQFKTKNTSRVHCNGPVTIYVKGKLSTGGTSSLNYKGDPRNLTVVSTEAGPDRVGIHNESTMWGRVEASQAEVFVSGTLLGDVKADRVKVYGEHDGSGNLYYFTELSEGDGGDGGLDSDGDFVYATTWVVK